MSNRPPSLGAYLEGGDDTFLISFARAYWWHNDVLRFDQDWRLMTDRADYVAFGAELRSPIVLPGAIPIRHTLRRTVHSQPIEILLEAIHPGRAMGALGSYRVNGDRLWFQVPNVATFLCEAGERIKVDPGPNVAPTDVANHLAANALPALLWMRGGIVLHAAVARLPSTRSAIAIGGISRSGKSTVLHRLVAAGAAVVTDDVVTLQETASGFTASGLPAAYLLAPRNARSTSPRILHSVPLKQRLESARLAALVILQLPRADVAPIFQRLLGVSALEAVLNSRHRPRVPRILGTERSSFGNYVALARSLPVYIWTRREGADNLDQTEMAFLAQVAEGEQYGRGVVAPY